MSRRNLIGSDVEWLEGHLSAIGVDTRHAAGLLRWIYRRRVFDLSRVNDIPRSALGKIAATLEVAPLCPCQTLVAADGSTKHLYRNGVGMPFESVLMRAGRRRTLCISSQSGCRMGCKFCMTGSVGFRGSLSAGDMLSQLLSLPDSQTVNRIVVMGMGEPFDNAAEVLRAVRILTAEWGCAFGRANITLSSVGMLDELRAFLSAPACNLAISLHSPFPDERATLMPIERASPLAEVVALIRSTPLPKPLRVSFEYVALGGVNLSECHALAVSELLRGMRCHLNIIPWNPFGGAQFSPPASDELQRFIARLNSGGVPTTVRRSMAADIGGACGQLAAGS